MENLFYSHYDPFEDGDLLTEMATVGWMQGRTRNQFYLIAVDSSPHYIGNPYFKVFGREDRLGKPSIARISFIEPRYIIHYKNNAARQFRLNSKMKRMLIDFMNDPCDDDGVEDLTNWQHAIIIYNREAIGKPLWKTRQWKQFDTEYILTHKDEINGTKLQHALPIDLKMPDYRLLP